YWRGVHHYSSSHSQPLPEFVGLSQCFHQLYDMKYRIAPSCQKEIHMSGCHEKSNYQLPYHVIFHEQLYLNHHLLSMDVTLVSLFLYSSTPPLLVLTHLTAETQCVSSILGSVPSVVLVLPRLALAV